MNTAIVLLSLTAASLPLVRWADRRATPLLVLGEAMLFGPLLLAVIMALESLFRIPWSLAAVIIPFLLASGIAFIASVRHHDEPPSPSQRHLFSWPFDAATFALFGGYVLYAVLANPWDWDYWAIWGLKGRIFFLHRGIDVSWLANQWNSFVHPDYPPLLPLLYSFLAMAEGVWNDRWFGLPMPFFAAGAMLVVRSLLGRMFDEWTGVQSSRIRSMLPGAAALAASCFLFSRWVGMAEVPLIAYLTAGLLLVRRDLDEDHPPLIGALFLGAAALTKNEGLSLLLAATIALGLMWWKSPRRLLRLAPAWALAGSWQIARISLQLSNDLFEGKAAERVVGKLAHLRQVLDALGKNPPDLPLFWFGALVVLILCWRRAAKSERFLVTTISLQILFFIGAYVVTPHDVYWHVENSWVRILSQLGAIIASLVFLAGGRELIEVRDMEEA